MVEEVGLGVGRDVVGDCEDTVGTCSFGVDDSLGDAFAVELSQFVNEVEVLKQDRSTRASCLREHIIVNWHTCAGSDNILHIFIFLRY